MRTSSRTRRSRAGWRWATRATTRARCARPSSRTATGSPRTARTPMRRAWAEFFTQYDLSLCPVAATAALPHDHKGERHERTVLVNGRRLPVTDHLFWAGYTGAFYLPATAAPCGFTPGGLPVG